MLLLAIPFSASRFPAKGTLLLLFAILLFINNARSSSVERSRVVFLRGLRRCRSAMIRPISFLATLI